MAVGLSTAHANALLEIYRSTSFTSITLYAKLHTGDPGAAATSNVSAVTTRNACTFAAASGGSMALASSPTAYSMTATETISHISFWDASSGGNLIRTGALAASKSVVNGDTFTLTTATFSYTPLAA